MLISFLWGCQTASAASRSMLRQIERGEANPSVAILGKLAGALKGPAEVLLENDDFAPLLLARELDNKPARLDGGGGEAPGSGGGALPSPAAEGLVSGCP